MRNWLSMSIAAAYFMASAPGFAQQQPAPNTQPAPIVEAQNGAPTAPSTPLEPGPPAGDQAPYLSTSTLIVGGVVLTAAVVCAIACFSSSTSATTSTTVTHH